MKAVCSTQTKGAFTLSSYKNALFGCSHLENCPENLSFFPFLFVSNQQEDSGGGFVILFVFCR